MSPCGVPSLRQMWTRWERPRAFASVTTQAPCRTGLSSATRQPRATTAPAVSGRSSSHGGGADTAGASATGGDETADVSDVPTDGGRDGAFGGTPSTPWSFGAFPVVATRGARIAATPLRAAPSVTAAAAPTAALPINVRRESIVHPLLRKAETDCPRSLRRDARIARKLDVPGW